jgi:N-acetylneuraminic acid mutarotase
MISLMSIIIVFFAMSPYGPHTSVSQTPTKNADYSWTTGAPLPTARSEIAGAALDGKIYIVGGFNQRGSSSNSVEIYDMMTDKWTAADPLPRPLDHTAAASYGGKLYVVGGGYLNRAGLSDKLFIYDPSFNKWTEGASLPRARGALTVNFIDGILYAVGGVDSTGTLTSNLAYDPTTNMWTEKAPMPSKRTSNICSCMLLAEEVRACQLTLMIMKSMIQ